MENRQASLETLQDIKRMMERSSRFLSLSGLSGIAAGIFALSGAYLARDWIAQNADPEHSPALKWKLLLLALAVLALALIFSFYFTWRKAGKNNLPVWDHSSKNLLINLLIPLAAGGLFVLGLLEHGYLELISPACLIFYGIALFNASKYTLSDIRYIGLMEIALGCIAIYCTSYGLYFWAVGFGLLHIIYGAIMWLKYDLR